mgnify:CR=1 FL=1
MGALSAVSPPATNPDVVVTVIIPTLGRPTLRRAMESVVHQQVRSKILIVNDSGRALSEITDFLKSWPEQDIDVITTDGHEGAAHARNLGMARVSSAYIAFLDDDDYWLPTHLDRAVSWLERNSHTDLYSCRALVKGLRQRREPLELLGDRTLLSYLYGPDIWRSRNRRILTPTIVFRRDLAAVPMDPRLHAGEDTWWLLSLEAKGYAMYQSPEVGGVVEADETRQARRVNRRRQQAWARRVDQLQAGAGAAYLFGVEARAAARSGRPDRVLGLVASSRGLRRRWRWCLLVPVWLTIGCLQRIVHRGAVH